MATHCPKAHANRRLSLVGLVLVAITLGGCQDAGPLAPTISLDRASAGAAPSKALTALTWNIYVGTDVDTMFAALQSPSGADDIPTLLYALQILQETDVAARAAAIADQVARYHPHIIGFEEVSAIQADLTGLGIPVNIDVDYAAVLSAALAARGLDYDLVVTGPGIDITLPGVHLTDHDVLFVDHDRVTVLGTDQHTFTANLGTVLPGVTLVRGWTQARIEVNGTQYLVVDTHPESDQGETSLDALRVAQMGQLVGTLASEPRVLIMGDLNGRPGSNMYGVLTGAGYTDAWAALRPGAAGYSCCHPPDLSDKVAAFDHRIDYMFAKGFGRPGPGLQGRIDRLGDVPADRVQGPDYRIWPSDHAGLVATFLSTPATAD